MSCLAQGLTNKFFLNFTDTRNKNRLKDIRLSFIIGNPESLLS